MSIGALGGYKMTSRVGDSIANAAGNFTDSVRSEYYAGHENEYQEKQMAKYIKDWKQNDANMQMLQRNLSAERFKELTKKDEQNKTSELDKYLQQGFDVKDIIAGERFAEENRGMTRDAARAALTLNQDVAGGDFRKLSEKKKNEWRDTMSKQFMSRFNTKDANDSRVQQNTRQAEEYITRIAKIRSQIS